MDGNGVHRREVEVARNNEESREPPTGGAGGALGDRAAEALLGVVLDVLLVDVEEAQRRTVVASHLCEVDAALDDGVAAQFGRCGGGADASEERAADESHGAARSVHRCRGRACNVRRREASGGEVERIPGAVRLLHHRDFVFEEELEPDALFATRESGVCAYEGAGEPCRERNSAGAAKEHVGGDRVTVRGARRPFVGATSSAGCGGAPAPFVTRSAGAGPSSCPSRCPPAGKPGSRQHVERRLALGVAVCI